VADLASAPGAAAAAPVAAPAGLADLASAPSAAAAAPVAGPAGLAGAAAAVAGSAPAGAAGTTGDAALAVLAVLGTDSAITAGGRPAGGSGAGASGTATAGSQTVEVPLNRRALVRTSPERVRRIREHLVRSLRAMRTMKHPERGASPLRPEPDGFVGEVARTACTLCQGWCCKGGGEHAYLDERTMVRVRNARPELEARAVIRLYVERVPPEGYEGSCVFHGPSGCGLDRSLRSDVCNSYFCSGLGNFVKAAVDVGSVVVVAGEGDAMRTSPRLAREPGVGEVR
jgi:hypothetical protein